MLNFEEFINESDNPIIKIGTLVTWNVSHRPSLNKQGVNHYPGLNKNIRVVGRVTDIDTKTNIITVKHNEFIDGGISHKHIDDVLILKNQKIVKTIDKRTAYWWLEEELDRISDTSQLTKSEKITERSVFKKLAILISTTLKADLKNIAIFYDGTLDEPDETMKHFPDIDEYVEDAIEQEENIIWVHPDGATNNDDHAYLFTDYTIKPLCLYINHSGTRTYFALPSDIERGIEYTGVSWKIAKKYGV